MDKYLPASKTTLRSTVNSLVADFLARGGKITVCRRALAKGNNFTRLTRPSLR